MSDLSISYSYAACHYKPHMHNQKYTTNRRAASGARNKMRDQRACEELTRLYKKSRKHTAKELESKM